MQRVNAKGIKQSKDETGDDEIDQWGFAEVGEGGVEEKGVDGLIWSMSDVGFTLGVESSMDVERP